MRIDKHGHYTNVLVFGARQQISSNTQQEHLILDEVTNKIYCRRGKKILYYQYVASSVDCIVCQGLANQLLKPKVKSVAY